MYQGYRRYAAQFCLLIHSVYHEILHDEIENYQTSYYRTNRITQQLNAFKQSRYSGKAGSLVSRWVVNNINQMTYLNSNW